MSRYVTSAARVSSSYLIAYNCIQAVGWSLVLIAVLQAFIVGEGAQPVYARAGGFTSELREDAVMHGGRKDVCMAPYFPQNDLSSFILNLLQGYSK